MEDDSCRPPSPPYCRTPFTPLEGGPRVSSFVSARVREQLFTIESAVKLSFSSLPDSASVINSLVPIIDTVESILYDLGYSLELDDFPGPHCLPKQDSLSSTTDATFDKCLASIDNPDSSRYEAQSPVPIVPVGGAASMSGTSGSDPSSMGD